MRIICHEPRRATCAHSCRFYNDNVGGETEPLKLVLAFKEAGSKHLVLNLTRAEAVSEIAGDEDTDTWPGTVIQLVKGTTRYQGKKVGCITVQKPLVASEVGF